MKALAKKMGIYGTPHFLVGDKSIPGAPEDLHEPAREPRGRLPQVGLRLLLKPLLGCAEFTKLFEAVEGVAASSTAAVLGTLSHTRES